MFSSKTNIRVRYADTDQMGYVYYGNYAAYFEVGRTESLRHMGFTYKDMEEQGVLMPVINMNVNYLKAAKYDDLLEVETIVAKMPGVRMVFDYKIHNQHGELLCTAQTTLVFISKALHKPVQCPEFLATALASFF